MPPKARPARRAGKAPAPSTETPEVTSSSESTVRTNSEDRPKVYYEKGLTRNLGDYNNVKITVGVSLPIDPTPEELASVNKTIEIANGILDAEIEKQIASIKE